MQATKPSSVPVDPTTAAYMNLGADVATDFIPGVSQVKGIYRAGKAAMQGDWKEAGKQAVGAVIPGGRRIIGAVDAAGSALQGDYKQAAYDLAGAAGGDVAKAASLARTGETGYKLAKTYLPSEEPTSQVAQTSPEPVQEPVPQMAQIPPEPVQEEDEELDRIKKFIRR